MAVVVRSVMLKQCSGSIINNGLVAAHRAGLSLSMVYSAARAVVVHLTRCVAMQLGESRVRVNSISTDGIATGIFGKALGLPTDKAEITPARLARVRAMDARQLAHADKHYAAHVRRCVPAAPRVDLSAKGRIGTVHTDPRIAYAFPGGQIKQVRFAPGDKLVPHPDSDEREVPYTGDAPEYVRRFCEANHLVSALTSNLRLSSAEVPNCPVVTTAKIVHKQSRPF